MAHTVKAYMSERPARPYIPLEATGVNLYYVAKDAEREASRILADVEPASPACGIIGCGTHGTSYFPRVEEESILVAALSAFVAGDGAAA